MNEKKIAKTGLFVFFWIIALTGLFGWLFNIKNMVTDCDFKAPYRCEFIRAAGIVIAPAGAVLGYMDIEDGDK